MESHIFIFITYWVQNHASDQCLRPDIQRKQKNTQHTLDLSISLQPHDQSDWSKWQAIPLLFPTNRATTYPRADCLCECTYWQHCWQIHQHGRRKLAACSREHSCLPIQRKRKINTHKDAAERRGAPTCRRKKTQGRRDSLTATSSNVRWCQRTVVQKAAPTSWRKCRLLDCWLAGHVLFISYILGNRRLGWRSLHAVFFSNTFIVCV